MKKIKIEASSFMSALLMLGAIKVHWKPFSIACIILVISGGISIYNEILNDKRFDLKKHAQLIKLISSLLILALITFLLWVYLKYNSPF